MLNSSFESLSMMKDWMVEEMVDHSNRLPWTVFENSTNTQVGMMALIAITPVHGRVEIGYVWLTPSVHKTKVNTESQFLMLRHLFDDHDYRRVEWKCDSLNHASRTAAALGQPHTFLNKTVNNF
jgi:RimJ/RimL family protein N-acetyltransferase